MAWGRMPRTRIVSVAAFTAQWLMKSATEVSPLSEPRRTGRVTAAAIG